MMNTQIISLVSRENIFGGEASYITACQRNPFLVTCQLGSGCEWEWRLRSKSIV